MLSLGTWLTTKSPEICDLVCSLGLEWICVDLEHTALGISDVGSLLSISRRAGIKSFVRVSSINEFEIRRVLDLGANGVIVPRVETASELSIIAAAVRYPPLGRRGLGLGPFNQYGLSSSVFGDLEKLEVIIQVETLKGVQNLRQLLESEIVDGVFVGPYDLSIDLGLPGSFTHPRYLEAINDIKKLVLESRKMLGIHVVHPVISDLEDFKGQGFNFIAYGTDLMFVRFGLGAAIDRSN